MGLIDWKRVLDGETFKAFLLLRCSLVLDRLFWSLVRFPFEALEFKALFRETRTGDWVAFIWIPMLVLDLDGIVTSS